MKLFGLLVLLMVGCASVSHFGAPSDEDMAAFRAPASGSHLDTSNYMYDSGDKSCGGYPRLKVETAPGTCLGLVMAKERAIDPVAKRGFSMPRTMVEIPGTHDFLVADMGSWHLGRGALFRMVWNGSSYDLKLLKAGLDYPHAVKLGPDGKFWIGELNQISRFSVDPNGIYGWQVMVSGLPAFPDDSHPLSQFAFDPRNNDLYINQGAPSDHCYVKGGAKVCPEVATNVLAGILRVSASDLKSPPATTWTPVARGLRNSMAMAISSAGLIIQGENARDFADLKEPYEELNVVDLSKPAFHYGWPYCYDFRATSPEWVDNDVVKCSAGVAPVAAGDYQEPYVLIPPHAAPLAAGYYHGKMFPQLEGTLLMAWHGYNPTGHRLVAYSVDSMGRPIVDQKAVAQFNWDHEEDACTTKTAVVPEGGSVRFAPYTELVTRWNERANMRPLGAPASFYVAGDGSIYMVEDKNQTIVRLAKDGAPFLKEPCDPHADDRIKFLAWRRAVLESPTLTADYHELQTKMIAKYCIGCHGTGKSLANDDFSGLDFLAASKWFVPGKPLKSKGLQTIIHEGTSPPMPLPGSDQFFGTAEGAEITALVQRWIGEIPTDIATRYAKTSLGAARKVRSEPGGTLCGSMAAGDTAYVDPRDATHVKQGGWEWARLYLPPDHKALKGSACAWPKDGVFYVATKQVKESAIQ